MSPRSPSPFEHSPWDGFLVLCPRRTELYLRDHGEPTYNQLAVLAGIHPRTAKKALTGLPITGTIGREIADRLGVAISALLPLGRAPHACPTALDFAATVLACCLSGQCVADAPQARLSNDPVQRLRALGAATDMAKFVEQLLAARGAKSIDIESVLAVLINQGVITECNDGVLRARPNVRAELERYFRNWVSVTNGLVDAMFADRAGLAFRRIARAMWLLADELSEMRNSTPPAPTRSQLNAAFGVQRYFAETDAELGPIITRRLQLVEVLYAASNNSPNSDDADFLAARLVDSTLAFADCFESPSREVDKLAQHQAAEFIRYCAKLLSLLC